MNAAAAYADLRRMGKPVVTTEDAALRLSRSRPAATRLLERLAHSGLVRHLRHGIWALDVNIDRYLLPEYLTAPFPAYLSFQTALYLHGMISQIPQVVYVASLGKPRRIKTALGTYSIHRVPPELFGGYEVKASGVRVATAEKALIDFLYLSNVRSRLFVRLPELELPVRFSVRKSRSWIRAIPGRHRRTMVQRRLESILERQRSAGVGSGS